MEYGQFTSLYEMVTSLWNLDCIVVMPSGLGGNWACTPAIRAAPRSLNDEAIAIVSLVTSCIEEKNTEGIGIYL